MSGGVDSRRRRAAQRPATRSTVTLELWRDPENDAERSCCSASAVRGARAIAHGMGLAHFTLDLRDEFRAGVVEPWLAEHAAGLTPNPCVRCNGHVRLDAMLDLRRPPRRRDAGHRPLRAPHARRACCAWPPTRPRTRPTCSPALSRATLARLRFPLGDLDEGRRCARIAAEHELPVASKPDSQDLCFLAGTGRAALPGPPRRPGRAPGRHRRRRRARPGPPPRRAPLHRRPAPRPRGRRRAPSRSTSLRTDAGANTVTVGPRAALATTRRARARRAPARAGAARSTPSSCATARRPCRARCAATRSSSHEPVDGAAPGQTAVFLRGDAVRRDAPQSLRDLRRDPRDVPGLLRGARPPAPAQRRRSCPRATTRRSCSRPRACTRSSPTSWASRSRRTPLMTTLPEVLPHARHRERRHDDPAPDLLRDARQLLDRRVLQAGRGRVRLGALARRASASTPTTSGSRSSRATTSSASAPTRRPSRRGRRSASRARGSSCCPR